jgi:hypothetical protein
MSKEQISTENIITKAVSPDGKTSYEKITQIKTYWNNMNPYVKRGLILYGTVTFLCYGTYNYQDGKRALMDIRNKNPQCSPSEEWRAIRSGINSADNFFSALFFPYSVASKVMPSVILFMNPKKA